jgi:predicted dehydrogenase
LGFLGVGWIARMRLEAIMNSDVATVAAIWDPSPESSLLATQISPDTATVGGCEELLQMYLDGVVIASPSALHAEQAIEALRHGHSVFCEKPLACTAAQTRAVLKEARRADRLLEIDFAYRFTAGMTNIRELIHSGALGDIYAVDLTFHNSYGPDKPWFYDSQLSGGGCVIDLGIHLIDAALWALDFPAASVARADLFARGKLLQKPVGNDIEDYAIATVELASGAVMRLACSWRLPLGQDALIHLAFHGTNGGAEFRNIDGSFYEFRAELYHGRERRQLCAPPDSWGGRAIVQWARRLSSDNRFDPAVESVPRVAEIIDAIYGRRDAREI